MSFVDSLSDFSEEEMDQYYDEWAKGNKQDEANKNTNTVESSEEGVDPLVASFQNDSDDIFAEVDLDELYRKHYPELANNQRAPTADYTEAKRQEREPTPKKIRIDGIEANEDTGESSIPNPNNDLPIIDDFLNEVFGDQDIDNQIWKEMEDFIFGGGGKCGQIDDKDQATKDSILEEIIDQDNYEYRSPTGGKDITNQIGGGAVDVGETSGVSAQHREEDFELENHAFSRYLRSYTLKAPSTVNASTPGQIIDGLRNTLGNIIERIQNEEKSSLRVQLATRAVFSREGEEDRSIMLLSYMERFFRGGDTQDGIDRCITKISKTAEAYSEGGSGFTLSGIEGLDIHVALTNFDYPMVGKKGPEIPSELKKKRAIVDLRFDQKNECFKWAVLTAGHEVLGTTASKSHLLRLNQEGLKKGGKFPTVTFKCFEEKWPIRLRDIKIWERENPEVGISVLYYDPTEKKLSPIHAPSNLYVQYYAFLLYTESDEKNDAHFFPIVTPSRLIPHGKGTKFFCPYCLSPRSDEKGLKDHLKYCSPHGLQVVEMLDESKSSLKFKNYHHRLAMEYKIFADFESIIQKVEKSNTSEVRAQHKPAAFAYAVVKQNRDLVKYTEHQGASCHVEGLKELLQDVEMCLDKIYDTNKPMAITEEDRKKMTRKNCWICEKPLEENPKSIGERSVLDHDHLTGSLRGLAHSVCNSILRNKFYIPVGFHNLSYDIKHLMLAFSELKEKPFKFMPIAKTSEKFMSLKVTWCSGKEKNGRKYSIQFFDTYNFLPKSLDTLVHTQRSEDPNNFPILRQKFPLDEEFCLLTRKGVFPYSYMDSVQRFEETILPDKEAFYNDLTQTEVSDEDYEFAHTVWNKLKCRNLWDYTSIYLASDVLSLADVFMEFSNSILELYQLEPNCYLSTPSLAYDINLKMMEPHEIQIITDQDIYLFIERGIYGGLVFHNDRYVKCDPDNSENPSYGLCLDANALYAQCMSTYRMPIGEYRVLDPSEYPDFKTVEDNGEYGYFVEVSGILEKPRYYQDFPHPVSREKIHFEDLSPFNQKRVKEEKILWTSCEKLVASLRYKKNIILHHVNLKWIMNHDFRVDTIHKVVRFRQEFYMKPYIDHFMEKRAQTTSKTKSELFKLFNNTIFGKSVEQERKRMKCSVVTNLDQLRRMTRDVNFSSFTIVSENMALIFKKKRHIFLRKNIAAGASILSISKKIMSEAYWDRLVPHFTKEDGTRRIKLAYMDTDSLFVKIHSHNLLADLTSPQLRPIMDFSNWDPEKYSDLVKSQKKNELGRLKNELGSDYFTELFIGGPKCYCVVTSSGSLKRAAKGVSSHLIKKYLTVDKFEDAIFRGQIVRSRTNMIRSVKFKLYTVEALKIAICGVADKVYVMDDGLTTLPLGHPDLKEMEDKASEE